MNKLNYKLFIEPTHFFEGRQMYRLSNRIKNLEYFLSDRKMFWDIFDCFLGCDLMYDLALNHTFKEYFMRFPNDEKRILENILFL